MRGEKSQYVNEFDCGTFFDRDREYHRARECKAREPLFKELRDAKKRITALETALLPFAQIGDIANDSDCTLWKRAVSAGSVRAARKVLGVESAK
jgi:hypothetical protein